MKRVLLMLSLASATCTFAKSYENYLNSNTNEMSMAQALQNATEMQNGPEISESITDTKNVKWQLMHCKNNGKYLKYDKNSKHISLVDGFNPDEDAYYFAIVKSNTKDGKETYKIYNKEAGNNCPLSYANANDGTEAKFEEKGKGSDTWEIGIDAQKDKYYIKAADATAYLNNHANGNVLKFWNGKGDDNSFFYTESLSKLVENIKKYAENNYVNYLKKEKVSDFEEKFEGQKDITEGFRAAMNFANEDQNKLKMTTGYYEFKNFKRKVSTGENAVDGNGGYLEAVDKLECPDYNKEEVSAKGEKLSDIQFYANDEDETPMGRIWKATVTESGSEEQFTLQNLNSGNFIKDANKDVSLPATQTENEALKLTTGALKDGRSYLKATNGGDKYMQAASWDWGKKEKGLSRIIFWDDKSANSAGAWYISKVEYIPLTIGATKYATVNLPVAVTIPKGVQAYYASSVNNTHSANGTNSVVLKEIKETIPANTPVVIIGEDAKTYNAAIANESSATAIESDNLLKGTTMMATVEADKKAYILAADDNNKAKFFQLNNEDRNMAQNKAYLDLTNKSQNANIQAFSIEFGGEDGTTGIEQVENQTKKEVTYYDLQGRRVVKPSKGVYVTSEGKKVLFY